MKIVSIAHIIGGIALLVILKKFYSEAFVQSKWWLFALIGLSIGLYHGMKFYEKPKRWIYLLHVLLVAPSIFFLGIYPRVSKEVLQLVAVSMIAYHAAILADVV